MNTRCYHAFKDVVDPARMDAAIFLSHMHVFNAEAIEALVNAVNCCSKYKHKRKLVKQYDARGTLCFRLYERSTMTNSPAVDTLMLWFDEYVHQHVFDYLTQQSGIMYQALLADSSTF